MIRCRIHIDGLVQGVGFRPFVYGLATRHGLTGTVGNTPDGVVIEVQGPEPDVAAFRATLADEAPPLAVIEQVRVDEIPVHHETSFVIVPSSDATEDALGRTWVPPDVATCDACLRELWDPEDRRYRYPFVNCTDCGPRYTIIRGLPYDREATTMAGFSMCAACQKEYADPTNRRFHAQPVCCPQCGPTLRLVDPQGRTIPGDPISQTAELLHAGQVVAVKGLGGYHLAVDATSASAVRTLRERKRRPDKPFAIMVADLDTARSFAEVGDEEARVLRSARRPIVLLPARHVDGSGRDGATSDRIAPEVAPGSRTLGLFLPYTPLHHLLAAEFPRPFVLTSGNGSDEPITYADNEALARLGGIADAFLMHDRPIHARTDDSVVRVFTGRPMPVRRARGYAPQPVRLPNPVPEPVLGCGAELKNTFCMARDGHAFVSPHLGDLKNADTYRAYTEQIAHLGALLGIEPRVVAYDLHPDYLSTKYAQEKYAQKLPDVQLVGVQHHHAHIASCLADNGESEPVIGIAFDGLGFGTDGTIWGGEFLVADLAEATRVGSLSPVPMPGGAAAVRQPWRMAAAYLREAYRDAVPEELAVLRRHSDQWRKVLAAADAGVNAPVTSSAGRLFDAVAALLGVRDAISYEGQAAIELEQLADPDETAAYQARFRPPGASDTFAVEGADLVRAAAEDALRGVPPATIAGRFHRGMAEMVVHGAERIRETTGVDRVALSGGVFGNMLLLEWASDGLRHRGFTVLTHQQVPPNDGGISLGQVAVAGARLR